MRESAQDFLRVNQGSGHQRVAIPVATLMLDVSEPQMLWRPNGVAIEAVVVSPPAIGVARRVAGLVAPTPGLAS